MGCPDEGDGEVREVSSGLAVDDQALVAARAQVRDVYIHVQQNSDLPRRRQHTAMYLHLLVHDL